MAAGTPEYNNSNLGLRLGADVASAAATAAAVAPIICTIDRSIIVNSAQPEKSREPMFTTFRQSARAIFTSRFYVSKPFLLVFALYGSTYLAANAYDTAASTLNNKPATTIDPSISKLIAVGAVNTPMCVFKDGRFVRIFGRPKHIPAISYTLWAVRDCMTVFGSFNMPQMVADKLGQASPAFRERFSYILESEKARLKTGQCIAPMTIQLLSTPIFLLGLDLQERPAKLSVGERVAKIRSQYIGKTLARMARILPAFGGGGIINIELRPWLMQKFGV